MNQQNYTSLDLSKFLAESGFQHELDCFFFWTRRFEVDRYGEKTKKWALEATIQVVMTKCKRYPAYDLLWDIGLKYHKEIFGEDWSHVENMFELVCKKSKQEAEQYIMDNTILKSKKK